MSETLDMPELLRQWFFSNVESISKVSRLLHELPVTIKSWLYLHNRIPHWQLARIIALMELGLVPDDYGTAPKPKPKEVQTIQAETAIEVVERYLREGRAIGNACACAAHDTGLDHTVLMKRWYQGKHKGLE